MKKMRLFLILGVWLVVLPYLGFPYSWKDVLVSISGLGLVFLSYIFYKELKVKEIKENKGEKTFDNFSENKFINEEKN